MRASRWFLIAAVLTAVAGCGSDGHAPATSATCRSAWAAFDRVARVPPPGSDENPGSGADADAAAAATLRSCSSADEWWAASRPYWARTVGADVPRQPFLDRWCQGYGEEEAPVCAAD